MEPKPTCREKRLARRARKRKRLPEYKDGGTEALIRLIQKRFPVPPELAYDERIYLQLVLDKNGKVEQVQLETELNRQAPLVAMEDSLIRFCQSLEFIAPRYQIGREKYGGFVKLFLVYKVEQVPCDLPDTLRLPPDKRGRPPVETSPVVISGALTDKPTGAPITYAYILSQVPAGTEIGNSGRYQPRSQTVGNARENAGYVVNLKRDTHFPQTNLLFINAPDHRNLYIPDVPYRDLTMDIELERCVSLKPAQSNSNPVVIWVILKGSSTQ